MPEAGHRRIRSPVAATYPLSHYPLFECRRTCYRFSNCMGTMRITKRIPNWSIEFLKIGLASAIIWYMIVSGKLNLPSIWAALFSVKFVAPGISLMFCGILISAWRWRILLAAQDIHITYYEALKLTYIGAFFNTTLPGAVTGDVVKGYYIIKTQGQDRKIAALTTILLDRVVGISGLIIVAGGSLVLNFVLQDSHSSLAVKSLQGLVTGLALFVASFYTYVMIDFDKTGKPRDIMRRALSRLPRAKLLVNAYDSVKRYGNHPRVLFCALFASCIVHVFLVTSFILFARAMNETSIRMPQYFLLVPLGLITTALPVAPGGIGVGHAAFLALFHLVGSPRGADIFTLFVGIGIVLNLFGVFLYLGYKKEIPSDFEQPDI